NAFYRLARELGLPSSLEQERRNREMNVASGELLPDEGPLGESGGEDEVQAEKYRREQRVGSETAALREQGKHSPEALALTDHEHLHDTDMEFLLLDENS
ncbi:unnamed protein product, partial [Sphacelaria rigidula]